MTRRHDKHGLEGEKTASFYRSCVKNGDSKQIALTPILKDWEFVEITVIESNDNDVLIRISKVGNKE